MRQVRVGWLVSGWNIQCANVTSADQVLNLFFKYAYRITLVGQIIREKKLSTSIFMMRQLLSAMVVLKNGPFIFGVLR